jgi:hypothetical protein
LPRDPSPRPHLRHQQNEPPLQSSPGLRRRQALARLVRRPIVRLNASSLTSNAWQSIGG